VIARRRLPLRVDPLHGEAIDSWLEATAEHMGTTVGALARAAELPIAARPGWIRWISADQLRTVEAATGVSQGTVRAMTLSSYDGAALKLDPVSHRLDPTFPFGALAWSRFCGDCLAESHGRWQLSWRLGWSFACIRHNRLLADACPECGKYQRRQQIYRRVPIPPMCSCGCSLETTHTLRLPTDNVVLDAQRQIFDVIDEGNTSFGVFNSDGPSVRKVLAAVRSLANRVLNYASTYGLAAVESAGVSLCLPEEDADLKPLRARSALNEKAPSRAIETAVGVTVALHILRCSSFRDAGIRARSFIAGQNADTGPAELRSCARDDDIAAAVVMRARSIYMGPELQLRYRTAITMPCAPDLDVGQVQSMADALPAAMWPEWSQSGTMLPRISRYRRADGLAPAPGPPR
jgi:hypothetical protein